MRVLPAGAVVMTPVFLEEEEEGEGEGEGEEEEASQAARPARGPPAPRRRLAMPLRLRPLQ